MEHVFFKEGEYHAAGGFFVRNDLKNFFKVLTDQGLNPIGIKVDDSFNLEVMVEINQAYVDREKQIRNSQG